MGEDTTIGWTDHTFNGWWGCTKVSPACDNCYAETFAHRLGMVIWGKDADRRTFGDKHWNEPLKWQKAAAAGQPGANTGRPDHLVFCASMADVFEERDDLDPQRARLWELIEATPNLTWLLLTKRPQHVNAMVPQRWRDDGWPENAAVGTTVEDDLRARVRLGHLCAIPAKFRFVSMEPLLESVDVRRFLHPTASNGVNWVICGGESGHGFRPLPLDAAREIRDQCLDAHVPFFFKQVGGRTPTAGGDELDGTRWKQFPA